jgi:hypothetical protein
MVFVSAVLKERDFSFERRSYRTKTRHEQLNLAAMIDRIALESKE